VTADREARHFQFHPHVQLVRGAVGAAVHDLFAARVYWFREAPVAAALSALALGDRIEDAARAAGLPEAHLEPYVDVLVRLQLGARTAQRTAVEGYRPILLHSQARENQVAVPGGTVTVEISSRCVYDCHWCTSRSAASPRACTCGVWADDGAALPAGKLLAAVEQLASLGVERVVLRGGEPFLEQATLWAVLDLADHLGMACNIHSTGMLIEPDQIERLRGRRVRLTLMVASRDITAFDAASRSPGSGGRLHALLPRLVEAGLPFVAKVPAMAGELEDAKRCAAWALDAGAAGVEYLLHAPADSMEELRRAFGPASPADMAVDVAGFHKNGDGHSCFDRSLFIARDGTVAPCPGLRHPLGSLQTAPMAEILRTDAGAFAASKARRAVATCDRCEFRMGCWACLARTVQIEKSADGPHWNCRYAPAAGEWK
jgi:radical SAM protein with 4Fe4S-binding SPASM domain